MIVKNITSAAASQPHSMHTTLNA